MVKCEESHRLSEDHSDHFEIRVKGHLSPCRSEFFSGLKVIHTVTGETILTGPVVDQAELHGILAKVRDLNLALISVSQVESEQPAGDDQISDAQ